MALYKLSKDAVLETFDDGGLVLILPERRLVELNPSAVEIVRLLDGQRTANQITAEIFSKFGMSVEQISQDVNDLCYELSKSGILIQQKERQETKDMTFSPGEKLLRNPDVVLREEDPEEGGLLFNPDTNQVKVINATSLFIWQQCSVARTLEEIVAEVKKGFEEVPSEQVAQDVREFMDVMITSGFIGTVDKAG
jgi:hypothetical protein